MAFTPKIGASDSDRMMALGISERAAEILRRVLTESEAKTEGEREIICAMSSEVEAFLSEKATVKIPEGAMEDSTDHIPLDRLTQGE